MSYRIESGIESIAESFKSIARAIERISPTDEGDTKTNRAREAGELEELKKIQEMLIDSVGFQHTKPWESVNCREKAMVFLKQLIQKREGLDQS